MAANKTIKESMKSVVQWNQKFNETVYSLTCGASANFENYGLQKYAVLWFGVVKKTWLRTNKTVGDIKLQVY